MEEAPMETPGFLREIGNFAWIVARMLGATAAVMALFFWLFRTRPILGLIVFHAVILAGMIVFAGWQSYNLKLKDLEYRRNL